VVAGTTDTLRAEHPDSRRPVKPGKTGLNRLLDATGYSWKGIRACWRHEAAFRQEVALCIVLFPLSFFIARSLEQWLLLVLSLLLLLIVELLNTAVENVVDRIGDELHDLSGQAKDMGSAAVLLSLAAAALCWFTILLKNLA
jgi:diacylglycerol kinase (ATP)